VTVQFYGRAYRILAKRFNAPDVEVVQYSDKGNKRLIMEFIPVTYLFPFKLLT
jgi:hypothetical protein